MPRAGSRMLLPIAIATLRKNWSLAPMNSSALTLSRQPRRQRSSASREVQATLRWCISSPIVRPRAISGLSGMPCTAAQRATQERSEFVPQPGEAREHLGVVAAEAHHLAEPFVDRAGGPVAEFAVLHHEQRHAARGDAGHRPDRAEMMVGRELDRAARRRASRPPRGRRPNPRTRSPRTPRRASGRTCAAIRSAARRAGAGARRRAAGSARRRGAPRRAPDPQPGCGAAPRRSPVRFFHQRQTSAATSRPAPPPRRWRPGRARSFPARC